MKIKFSFFLNQKKIFKAIPYEESEDSNVVLMTENAKECSLFVSEKEKNCRTRQKRRRYVRRRKKLMNKIKKKKAFLVKKNYLNFSLK